MGIRPSVGIDQTWYSKSETLNGDSAKDFPSLVKRIQLFNRDSLILMISGCSWVAWSLPSEDNKTKTDLNYILFRYSLFIGSLALIYCPKDGAALADEVDLRILVGELFNIGGMEPDADWFIKHEVLPLQKRLEELSKENFYLSKIDPKDSKILSSLLLMSRTALIQWDGISFSGDDWLRSVLLYEKYREIAIQRSFCNSNELQKAERQFLGTTADHLMRAVLLLVGLFKPSGTNPPGALDPKHDNLPPELEERFKVTNEDIGIAADRFSINASELQSKKEILEQLPVKAWLCSKELWSLHDQPMVRLDDKDPDRLILSISPQRLHPKSANILLHELVRFYEVNNLFKAKDVAYHIKGYALEDYVLERTRGTSVVKVDPLLPVTYKGKRPDFIWIGSEWTILFEVKANVKINSDKTFFNSSSLVDSWKILTEPIDQCREAIAENLVKTKKCCLVVITNDNICEPMTNFKRIAKHWGFLNDTGIDSLAILSLSQFETALNHHSADTVGKSIQNTWDILDPLSVDASLLDYDFFDAYRFQKDSSDHIAKKWKELFPAFTLP